MENANSASTTTWARELAVARAVAAEAGALLMQHYAKANPKVREKADASPITDADEASHALLLRRLRENFPDDAVLSEESGEEESPTALASGRLWMVDPLDGTRDFVNRSGDFAVHVGLVERGIPVVGVVHVPVSGLTYGAVAGGPAQVWDSQTARVIRCSTVEPGPSCRVAVGRFHIPPNVAAFLDAAPFGNAVVRLGASVKLMALAEGKLELALWLHDAEKVWDSCAPSVIVQAAGGIVTDVDGQPLRYGGPGVRHERGIVVSNGRGHDTYLRACRPYFHAEANKAVP